MWLDKLWYRAIKTVSALAGWGFGIIGVLIVLMQVVKWLKHAIWEPYTIGNALHDWGLPDLYTPNMLGVQKIINEILSLPGIVGYMMLAAGCMGVLVWADRQLVDIERKEQKAEREKQRAEREKEQLEEAREEAGRSKADFDFNMQIEEVLGKRRDIP